MKAEFNGTVAGVNDDNTTGHEECGDMTILIAFTGWPKYAGPDHPAGKLMFEMMTAASEAARRVFNDRKEDWE